MPVLVLPLPTSPGGLANGSKADLSGAGWQAIRRDAPLLGRYIRRRNESPIRAFLSSKIGQSVPTEQAEKDNPKVGDAFYERGGGWLRENTRDTKKFPVLFSENITYGYRRNLLGLKWPALGLNAAMLLLCLFILNRKGAIDTEDDVTIGC